MQHLENDMDDLFRRASENYSLQNSKDDWESIAKQIQDKSDLPELTTPRGRKSNKIIITFFLLLFLILVGWLKFQNPLTGIFPRQDKILLTKEMVNPPNNPFIKKDNGHISGGNAGIGNAGNSKTNDYRKGGKIYLDNSRKKITTGISDTFFHTVHTIESLNENISKTYPVVEMKQHYNNLFSPKFYYNKNTGKDSTGNEYNIDQKLNQDKISYEDRTDNEKNNDSTAIRKKTSGIVFKRSRVYIGIAAGNDFSRVHSMPFSSPGFLAGLLLGYKVNAKFSLETGALWNHKNYNSEGQSFNMDKVRSTMPTGMIINNLKSQSTLVEIPIKARYGFLTKNNSAFFIAGGVSVYIMTKEKNRYNVTMNGNQENITGIYDNNNYGLPAVANISIGYEHKFSGHLGIGIEPFFKIPLRGIGIGSLPVTSAGLQIGITHQLK